MKRRMKRKNMHGGSLTSNRGNNEIRSKFSSLKQEIIQAIYLGQGNMETLKAKFPRMKQNSAVASLIYILEAESMIKMVNGEYTLTTKGVQFLKEEICG